MSQTPSSNSLGLDIVNDSSNFKTDETKQNELATQIPDCIKRLRPGNPDREPLNKKQTAQFMMHAWNKRFCELSFPRTRKFRKDPEISGQTFGIISFMPAPYALPDHQGCFGTIKLRGNFATVGEAESYGEYLVRNHDNYADYDLIRVGLEVPLMIDNSMYTSETREVDIRAKTDEITKAYNSKRKQEERKQREEVEERHRKLVNKDTEEDEMEAANDLEFYTTLRTKKAHCLWTIDEAKKKMKEAEETAEKMTKQIAEMDLKFPTYHKDYIMQYEKGLKAVGTDVKQNPLINYMKAEIEQQPLTSQPLKVEEIVDLNEEEKKPLNK